MNSLKEQMESDITSVGLSYVWIDNAIGIRRGKIIFLNKNLLLYPDYCKRVVNHEIRHSDGYEKKDVIMDLTEASLWDNFMFALKHPKAFTAFLPIDYYGGEWYFDFTLIITYLFYLIVVICILWIIIKRNTGI